MKKLIALLFLLALCLVSACGDSAGEETSGDEIITLSVWHYYGGTTNQTFSYLVENFNQTVGAENGIVVEAFSYDSVSALAQAVEASAYSMAGAAPMPAIFAAYADSVVPLDAMGLIADLDDNFTQEELDAYYAPFIEEGRIGDDGSLKILPIAKSTEVLHLNKTVFDLFAQDTGYTYDDLATWEGLSKVAAAYYTWSNAQTDTPNDGKAFFGTDGMANFMIAATKQLGYDIFTTGEDGAVYHQFTKDIAKKLWNAYYIPYIQGYYTANASYRSDDVSSGDIIAYVGSTASSYWFPNYCVFGEEIIPIECITLPYPVFEGYDAVAVQQGAGMVVSSSTPEIEAAAAIFLKWFTDSENNCGFAVSTGYMPVKNDALDLDVILAEMSRDGSVDTSLPIVQSTYTSYEQLDSYELYTSIPFLGSDDARDILEYSLPNLLALDFIHYSTRLAAGESSQSILTSYISDAHFTEWYEDISLKLGEIVSPYDGS